MDILALSFGLTKQRINYYSAKSPASSVIDHLNNALVMSVLFVL